MPSPRVAVLAFVALALGAAVEPVLISQWSFEAGTAGNAVPGGPAGEVVKAEPAEGRSGKALAFQDWSTRDYLKPDPRAATRVVIPHDARLNPPYPFRVSAWIHPTADPIFYGGIVEKGAGRGSSYRLVLLRGLKVEASLGDEHLTVRSASPIALNAWHEVQLVTDGRSLALRIDGVEAAARTLAAPPRLGSTGPLIIGDRFTGRIDEVSVSAP